MIPFIIRNVDNNQLPLNLVSLFSALTYCERSGNELIGVVNDINFTITGLDYSETDLIPGTSTCTLSLQNNADLKVDDFFDTAFFDDAGAVKQVTIPQLQNNDYSRVLVRYSTESPHNIEWIGLLDNAAFPTEDQWNQLHTYFRLHIFWSGVWNDYGYLKDNKPLEGIGYKRWIALCDSYGFTGLSETVKASINKYILYLMDVGTFLKADRRFMFMLNDSGLVDDHGTVSLVNCDATRGEFPVAPTYTTRGWEGNGSSQYFNSKFIPITHGVNYQQNSAARSYYKYKARTIATSYIDGHASLSTNILTNANSTALQRINAVASLGVGETLNELEYIAINRSSASGSGSVSIYEGAAKRDYNITSTTLSAGELLVARSQFGYGDDGHSMANYYSSLSQTEHGYERTAILAHKTRLGL